MYINITTMWHKDLSYADINEIIKRSLGSKQYGVRVLSHELKNVDYDFWELKLTSQVNDTELMFIKLKLGNAYVQYREYEPNLRRVGGLVSWFQ